MGRRKGSHLTLADRIAIEDGLCDGAGIGGIAREVRRRLVRIRGAPGSSC